MCSSNLRDILDVSDDSYNCLGQADSQNYRTVTHHRHYKDQLFLKREQTCGCDAGVQQRRTKTASAVTIALKRTGSIPVVRTEVEQQLGGLNKPENY